MKPNLKFIHICILALFAFLLIGCAAPTEVEVTREVVVTRVVEIPAPANAESGSTNSSDSQLISIPSRGLIMGFERSVKRKALPYKSLTNLDDS